MTAIGSRESYERLRAQGRRPDAHRNLAHYLRGEYRHEVPWKLTTRTPDATGRQLSDRMVSRLEIANALRLLPYRQRRVIELYVIEDKSKVMVCDRLRISAATLCREMRAALETIIAVVYADWFDGAA
jgi:DNA-directed RNA polymerase specialized sigma24 family protein